MRKHNQVISPLAEAAGLLESFLQAFTQGLRVVVSVCFIVDDKVQVRGRITWDASYSGASIQPNNSLLISGASRSPFIYWNKFSPPLCPLHLALSGSFLLLSHSPFLLRVLYPKFSKEF